MKRHFVRLAALSAVVALGWIAIAQARHGFPGSSSDADQEAVAAARGESTGGAPESITINDPFDPQSFAAKPAADSPDDAVPDLPSRLEKHSNKQSRPVARQEDTLPPAAVVLASGGEEPPLPGAPAKASTVPAGGRYAASGDDRYGGAPKTAPPPDHRDVTSDERKLDPQEQAGSASSGRRAEPGPSQFAPGGVAAGARASLAQPKAGSASAPSAGSRHVSEPDPLPDINPLRSARSIRTVPPQGDSLARQGTARASRPAPDELPSLPARSGGVERDSDRIGVASEPRTLLSADPAAEAGSGRPGARQLEGAQAPSLLLEKIAPQEIQVGKECKFEIVVRNVGQVTAYDVEIHDEVPLGTSLVATVPPVSDQGDGRLVWQVGDLQPGADAKVEVQLMPSSEGEIGSVARVAFHAQASVRTIATKPELALRLTSAPTVMIGDNVRVGIQVSNPGSGAATNVLLLENIPEGMQHPAGAALEFEIGTLAAGETRDLELVLTAQQAGHVVNTLIAQSDANLRVEEATEFEVIAPQLAVDVQGPKRRYLERPATYVVEISNPGTAPAKDVELVTYLPPGLKFVKANNAGHYDPQTHSVSWGLDELPAQQAGNVELVAIPIEMGEQKLRVASRASQNLSDEAEQTLEVEGLAAVLFTVADLQDPIELNGETIYEIRVVNQGSKASTNLLISAVVPPGLKAISATGPTRGVVEGDRVVFPPLARLAPKADTTYQIKLQGVQAGDQRMRVQLQTDEIRTPVTKEESTRVYADE